LILGSGIAGLSAALKFASSAASGGDIRVTVLAKSDAAEGATRWAQGGIAAVWSKEDTFEEHVKDTLVAGADLCRESIVNLCVREGPERVRELIELGVEFTKSEAGEKPGTAEVDPAEAFDLHREGGHGQRRILHAADLTGWAIEKALLAKVASNPRITVLEDHCAIDLITEGKLDRAAGKHAHGPGRCLGVYVLNTRTGRVETISADLTILATGGAGKVYLYTSNPDTATGDGIAMAYRAGAKVANLEFIQFHPTCLYHPQAKSFLISEAVRGEGGLLRLPDGSRFMLDHDERAELATRRAEAEAETERLRADREARQQQLADRIAAKKSAPAVEPATEPEAETQSEADAQAEAEPTAPQSGLGFPIAREQLERLAELRDELFRVEGVSPGERQRAWNAILAKRDVATARDLTGHQAGELIERLLDRIAKRKEEIAAESDADESPF
jgi:aspartate oxidase